MNCQRPLFLIGSLTVLVSVVCLTDAAPWSKTLPMTQEETAQLCSYQLSFPAVDGQVPSPTVEEILSRCTYEGSAHAGAFVLHSYTSNVLPQYLTDCRQLTEISLVSGTVYLTYYNSLGDTIVLIYTTDGQMYRSRYRQATDTFYSLSPDSGLKYTHFRYGV